MGTISARRESWGKLFGAALVALVLLAFGAGGWLLHEGSQLQSLYEQKTEAKAQGYADRARIAVKRGCIPLPPAQELQCIREENRSARQGAHDEYDLQAQLVTSAWTRQMGIAAIIAMAFGVLGVGLVFVTFRETRKANLIARESAEAQVRAWLTIEFDEVVGFRIVNGAPHFHARILVTNIGHSPALAVSYWMAMCFGGDGKEHLDNMVQKYINIDRDWKEGSLFPGESFERRTSCEHSGEPPKGPIKVSVYLLAVYRTALSDKTRFTAHLFDVVDTRRKDDWTIDFKNPPSGQGLYMRTNKDFPGYAT